MLTASSTPAEELDLHLRITWGGETRRMWSGSVRVDEGSLREPRCLGIEADAPNGLELAGNTLKFFQRNPVSFDGLDFRVTGAADAKLDVQFTPVDDPSAAKQIEIPLSDFVSTNAIVHDSMLDKLQSRVQFQRAPGDRLRVQFKPKSLVFSPSEEFEFQVLPHALGLPEGTSVRCSIQLVTSPGEQVLWKEPHHDERVDNLGNTSPIGPVRVPLPEAEGVYDIVIALNQRRFSDAIVPSKPLMLRKIQLVVVDDEPALVEQTSWQLVEEMDSSNPKWWERWMWLPHWSKLRGTAPQGPLGDQPLLSRELDGSKLHEIGPSGWHAAPIPIANMGQPHILEIEYPRRLKQTLGISILEANAVDQAGTQGVDSGVDVEGSSVLEDTTTEKHRLLFWPRGKTPWLLLTNRRDDGPAYFQSVRVFAGPVTLPPSSADSDRSEGRIAAAYFDKPFFPESFGAAEARDPLSNRSLRDWNTFYLGAVRMAEYLKHAGYDTAFIPVACDGGALYPTSHLDTIPKYDNGTFFVSGQDPVSKDVLELLLRVFDREGLKLVPTLQFGTPIPELEEIARAAATDMEGVPLVGAFPGDSRAMLGRAESRRGLSPYYNPLDSRVQGAMRRVVAEVAERCQGHGSFGGLGVQLTPFSYTQMPDDTWALDDATFARFLSATKSELPANSGDRFGARLTAVRGPLREAWLAWRASEIASFYEKLQSDLSKVHPQSRLYLQMHELAAGRVVQAALRPQLPARSDAYFQDAMLRHGIDLNRLSKSDGIVVLRPQRLAPLTPISAQATNIELENSSFIDRQFHQQQVSGGLVYYEPQFLRLAAFDAVSPWGPQNTYTRLAATVSPSGAAARARLVQNVVALDAQVFASGGRTIPLGQEDSVRPLLRILRRLPAKPFETAQSRSVPVEKQDLVVRSLQTDGQTWIYVANATGMAAKVQIDLEDTPSLAAVDMAADDQSPVTRTGANTWTAQLDAHDLVAFIVAAPRARVSDWRVEFDAEDTLQLARVVQELRARVSSLRDPRRVDVLTNPSFEQSAAEGIPGWTFAEQEGISVRLDNGTAHSGRTSLHWQVTSSNAQAWIRSNVFPFPKTGRISVLARLRTSDAGRQPPLRISVDVKGADGIPYSKNSRPMGASQPLPVDWSGEFLFHVVNLPPNAAGEIRVGFDMLGPGEVWIDDVQVFDLYFQDVEQNELLKDVANAQLQLQKQEYAACHRFLQGYWPRFVLEHATAPRLAQVPVISSSDKTAPRTGPVEGESKSSYWNRLIPKPPFKLPLR